MWDVPWEGGPWDKDGSDHTAYSLALRLFTTIMCHRRTQFFTNYLSTEKNTKQTEIDGAVRKSR